MAKRKSSPFSEKVHVKSTKSQAPKDSKDSKESQSKSIKPSELSLRDQALVSARFHLQTKGFNGFSFQTVADDLQIRKPSLHYYFASKDQLGIELLKNYRQGFEKWVADTEGKSSKQKISWMIDYFEKLSGQGKKICPIGALCADINSLSDDLKKELLSFNQSQMSWLKELLQQAQSENVISKNVDVEIAASAIIAQIQGALQIARIQSNPKIIRSQLGGMFKLLKGSR